MNFVFVFGHTLVGQTGPGGVGTNDGTSSLKIWYRTDFGVNVTGALVNSVSNAAGIPALDISEAGAQRPTLVTAAVNGYSEMSFSGSNRLRTGLGLTTTNFVTNQASSFLVSRADNTTQQSCVYLTDPLDNNRFSNHVPWAGTVYYDIGSCCGTDARLQVGGLTGLNNYAVWTYDAIAAAGKQIYRNGTLLQNLASVSNYNSHASHRFNIGGNTTGSAGFVGDVTEVIVFNVKVNSAQRIIIDNYLAAKYGIALAANDVYTMDNAGNGNFDHDVAGIGRVDASNIHNDAQGTGILRILNPSNLDNNEFLIWGHNNGIAQATSTTDIPAGVQAKFDRVWRVSELNTAGTAVNVGSVDLHWDLSGLGAITTTDLRLLVDTDNDGVFADETPISGATSLGSNIYAFTGITALVNARRFTLATANKNQTPLPVTFLYLEASSLKGSVQIKWATASENNNELFKVERSLNGIDWQAITQIKGAGNSTALKHYEVIDDNPQKGILYYRIKQIDFNGNFEYSKISSVNFDRLIERKIVLYPNPAQGTLNFLTDETNFKIDIFNLHSEILLSEKNPELMDVSALSQGTYLVRATFINGEVVNQKLLIVK